MTARRSRMRNFVVLCLLFYAVVALLFTFVEVTTAQAACPVRPNCIPAPVPSPTPSPYFIGRMPPLAPVVIGLPSAAAAGDKAPPAAATLPPTDTAP